MIEYKGFRINYGFGGYVIRYEGRLVEFPTEAEAREFIDEVVRHN